MTDGRLSRRDVLQRFGAGTGAIGLFGTPDDGASDDPSTAAYAVGAASEQLVADATDRARHVRRTLDFGGIGTTVVGEFTDDAVAALEERDGARYVRETIEMELMTAAQTGQAVPWGIDRIDADVVHENGETGTGVHVAVLDSGIAANHPDLRPNIGEGRAFVDCVGGAALRCTVDIPSGEPRCEPRIRRCKQDWSDDVLQDGHGTHVAGTVAAVDNDRGVLGIAPGATLHSVKVANALGATRDTTVAAGLKHAADREWDVVNLSLGTLRRSPVLADAIQYAKDREVVLVAAVGNVGPFPNSVGFPARHPGVLAVGASTRRDEIAGFSSRGENVDLAAPGADVCSTVRGGESSSISGTSMACPHVAGTAALLLGSGREPDAIRARLAETAEGLGAPAAVQGAGLVDAAAALGYDSSDDGYGSGVCNPPQSIE